MSEVTCPICLRNTPPGDAEAGFVVSAGGLRVNHYPVVNGVAANRGHLLVEPARHIEDMSELSDEEAAAFGQLVAKVTKALKQVLGAEHVYLFRINDQVAHLHFHLIPRYPGTPREFWGLKILDNPSQPKVQLEEMQAVSAELARVLRG